jgi:hypothetical protein
VEQAFVFYIVFVVSLTYTATFYGVASIYAGGSTSQPFKVLEKKNQLEQKYCVT